MLALYDMSREMCEAGFCKCFVCGETGADALIVDTEKGGISGIHRHCIPVEQEQDEQQSA